MLVFKGLDWMCGVIGVIFNTCLIGNLLSFRLIFISFARIWQFFFCKYLSKRNTKEHQFPPFLVSYQLNLYYVRHMRFYSPPLCRHLHWIYVVGGSAYEFSLSSVWRIKPFSHSTSSIGLLNVDRNSHTLSITITTIYTLIKSKCTWRAMIAHDHKGRCTQIESDDKFYTEMSCSFFSEAPIV